MDSGRGIQRFTCISIDCNPFNAGKQEAAGDVHNWRSHDKLSLGAIYSAKLLPKRNRTQMTNRIWVALLETLLLLRSTLQVKDIVTLSGKADVDEVFDCSRLIIIARCRLWANPKERCIPFLRLTTTATAMSCNMNSRSSSYLWKLLFW